MHATLIFVSIFVPILVAVALALFLSSQQMTVDQDKARSRRLAEAKLNARLLRMNL